MTTIQAALQAYFAAVAQAQELHASGASTDGIQSVLKQARKLLTVIDDELEANGVDMPNDTRKALEQIRVELVELQTSAATRH